MPNKIHWTTNALLSVNLATILSSGRRTFQTRPSIVPIVVANQILDLIRYDAVDPRQDWLAGVIKLPFFVDVKIGRAHV